MQHKICFKCKFSKPLADFYKHPKMRDGHLGKCKDCAKSDVRANHQKNWEKHRIYEFERTRRPERRRAQVAYTRKRRLKDPERYQARTAVGNALRDGRILKQPCKYCGDPRTQAHHADYSKPLEVEWECFACHRSIEHGQRVNRK